MADAAVQGLIDRIRTDPHAPVAVGLCAPGGYGNAVRAALSEPTCCSPGRHARGFPGVTELGFIRGLAVIALLLGVVWAAWWIAWYVGGQTAGTTLPPPPGISSGS